MKKLLLPLFTLLFFGKAHGQAPGGFPYQAAMRNATGQALASQSVSLRFTLREGSSAGSVLYQETQLKTTSAQGMISCTVGSGSIVQGTFPTAAQWASGAKFLQVEADAAGGSNFFEISNTQLMSVPYATFANTSGSATTAATANALSTGATIAPSQITGNGATTGQILKWNGTSWAPANDGPANITASQITQSGASAGQVLKWNGTAWAPAKDSFGAAGVTLTAGTGLTITGSTINSKWTASGNDLFNNNSGNVGIGNSTPQYPLSIYSSSGNGEIEVKTGGASSYAGIRLANSSSASTLFTKSPSGLSGTTMGIPNAGLAHLNNGSSGSILLSTADSIAIGTGSQQRFRITQSGDVSIGGVSPYSRLHVKGSGVKYLIPRNTANDFSAAIFGVPDTITTAGVVSVGLLGQGKGSSYFNAGIAGFADNSGTFNVGAIFESKAGALTGKRNYGIYSEIIGGYTFAVGHYNGVAATIDATGGNYGSYTAVSGTAGANSYGAYVTSTPTSSTYTNYGVFGEASGGLTNYAGYFSGNVYVSGTLSKAGGTFQIDHPQDPENKYLIHSFVESPDMMNIYNGNITTDASGEATVTMPSYFDALNVEFRYQLTVMGPDFAQAIVSKKMENNTFKIKTDKPNIEVSWQVTGVRNDAWAKANRVIPEKAKEPNAKGKYLHPELFGKPASSGIHFVNSEGIAAPSKKSRNK